jgi:hypothetical protein
MEEEICAPVEYKYLLKEISLLLLSDLVFIQWNWRPNAAVLIAVSPCTEIYITSPSVYSGKR